MGGHAVMTLPEPRIMTVGGDVGAKLTPFSAAKGDANAGCGGIANGDPGVSRPTYAAARGTLIRVDWELTIPHPIDNRNTGVRVAIHYSPEDSFKDNVLVGCLDGDNGCSEDNPRSNDYPKSAEDL